LPTGASRNRHAQAQGIWQGGHPKALIEALPRTCSPPSSPPLLDAYDIYQHLMDYWAETMQDDAYLIAADGWVRGAQPREVKQVKDKNNKLVWPEPHDYLKGKRRFKSDLVPASILVAKYFAPERAAIDALDTLLATLEQQLDEMLEEHSGEDGLLAEVIEGEGDKQKISAKAVKARLKEIAKDPDYADERKVLTAYAAVLDQQAATKTQLKAAQEALDAKIDAKYPTLTEAEIKTLVVDDKWMAHLSGAVQGELDRVSQTLTGRIRELAERYATPPTAHRRGRHTRRPGGRTPQAHGGDMELSRGDAVVAIVLVAACARSTRARVRFGINFEWQSPFGRSLAVAFQAGAA
jgi:type I restriction enzyme M protein